MRRSGLHLSILTVVFVVATISGCATQRSALDPDALRRGAARGDSEAQRALAEAIAGGRISGAALLEAAAALEGLRAPPDRALSALVDEALGRQELALESWRGLLAAPATPAWLAHLAAIRVLALVDSVALGPPDAAAARHALERPDGPDPAVADVAEAIGARVSDPALVARAGERRGWIARYARTGRVAPWPALTAAAEAPATALLDAAREGGRGLEVEGLETPDGTIAFAEEGPGLYAAAVPIVASRKPLLLELVGEPAVSVFDRGQRIAVIDRLGSLAPGRVLLELVAGPERDLELQVSSRAAAPTLRAAVRPAAPGALESPPPSLVGRVAELDAALFDGDAVRAAAAAAALDSDARGVAVSSLVRQEFVDPTRPSALSSSRARRLLEAACAALADHAAARASLAAVLASAGEEVEARALAEALPSSPLREQRLLALEQERGATQSAAARAEAAFERAPTSCRLLEAVLDLRWDRLRHGGARLPAKLPHCPALAPRLATLELERGDPSAARARLDAALASASPGPERARIQVARSELAWRAGDGGAAARIARAGLEERAGAEELLLQLRRDAVVGGLTPLADEAAAALRSAPNISPDLRRPWLDPAGDLGLPLPDGLALALAAHRGGVWADAPVEVLLSERHVRILPDGTVVEREYLLFRIIEEGAADRWGEVGLPEGAEILTARTWKPTPDGGLQPIEPEDLAETGAVSLTALEPGAFGEVAWVTVSAPPASRSAAGRIADFAFESHDASVRVARLIVRADPALALRFDASPGVPPPEKPDAGTLIFAMTDRERVIAEPLDPRPDRRVASVAIGWGDDLRDLRLARADRARTLLTPTPPLAELAREALSSAGDGASAEDRLRALYALTLDTIQGGEGGVWQQSASWIATSRAGERAVLLTALCREAELDCELALARPKSRGAVDEKAKLADADDWVYPLVRGRVAGEEIWLDPSDPFVPFGYIPPLVQGVEVMVLTASASELARTPALPTEGGQHRIDVVLQLAADGAFTVRGDERLTGLYAMGWRHVLADLLPEARERGLAGVVRQSFPGVSVDRVDTSELRTRGVPLGLSWTARGALSERQSLTMGLSPEGLAAATVKLPERKTPLFIPRASDLHVSVSVVMPPGMTVRDPPRTLAIDGPLVSYRRTVRVEGARLLIAKELRLDLGTVAPAEYPAWVAAVRALDRADVLHLTFEAAP